MLSMVVFISIQAIVGMGCGLLWPTVHIEHAPEGLIFAEPQPDVFLPWVIGVVLSSALSAATYPRLIRRVPRASVLGLVCLGALAGACGMVIFYQNAFLVSTLNQPEPVLVEALQPGSTIAIPVTITLSQAALLVPALVTALASWVACAMRMFDGPGLLSEPEEFDEPGELSDATSAQV